MTFPEMILFDSGGTLCADVDYDTLRATRAIMPYLAANPRGVSAEELHEALLEAHGEIRPARAEGYEISQYTIMRLACAKCGVTLGLDMAAFERVFRIALTPVEMTPHIDELLAFLRGAGVRTGVVSNSKYSGVSLAERHGRLFPGNRFECFVSSCDYAVCKPKRALFDVALALTGAPRERTWYCGDSMKNDMIGARGAGLFPVLYDRGGDERADKTGCPEYLCVSDWRELIALLKELQRNG